MVSTLSHRNVTCYSVYVMCIYAGNLSRYLPIAGRSADEWAMGRVAEFEQELSRRVKSRFATHAIDLHNHTPASDDYQYRGLMWLIAWLKESAVSNLSVIMFT